MSTQHLQHLDRQLRPRAIHSTMLRRRLLIQVQPEQHRQTERPIRPQWKPHDHAQHHPAVSPPRHLHSTTGQHRVVVHSRAEHLQPAFMSKSVINGQKHSCSTTLVEYVKDRQSHPIQRPASRRKHSMKHRMMTLADQSGRLDHAGDGPSPGKHPPNHQRLKAVPRGGGHDTRHLLQQQHKRTDKAHGSFLSPCVLLS